MATTSRSRSISEAASATAWTFARHFKEIGAAVISRICTEPSTLLNYGENLAAPVLLVHGLHDDIVPVQSTLQMYEKLLLLGKAPDIIIAPTPSHWWASDEHYAIYAFGKIREYFRRHVGDGAR